ncbi:exopolysaccharide biosynthesis protein (plasmid) [Rhizobium sp. 32-5/1]|uniref:exopolysaccharide biosynthesis protein n=1 Tax=Rhizobium sp. 32-5/1 TaxID=3019602 RepID=UPI00240E872E|nr:exopolysaccharide biosynthesis protein [Rhizobium sp. 32-5/1]WEZ86079.1 exopolysaccharide biosynthesis protein [Rhizobium sp. 32-5/1]
MSGPKVDTVDEPHGIASAALARQAETARNRGGLPIGDALALADEASFGFVMLMLALPALIPVPGPSDMVFGSALAIVALQNRKASASAFAALQRHTNPMVRRIERIVRPGRLKVLTGPALSCVLALPVFAPAIAIALPIPFNNIAPVIAVCVIAIGLIERDGMLVLLGILLSLLPYW